MIDIVRSPNTRLSTEISIRPAQAVEADNGHMIDLVRLAEIPREDDGAIHRAGPLDGRRWWESGSVLQGNGSIIININGRRRTAKDIGHRVLRG